MADLSTIEYELKDIESAAQATGISIVSESGQVIKSAEQRKLESEPSKAELQAELKRTMSDTRAVGVNKANDRLKAQRAYEIQQKIIERGKLDAKHDPSKQQGKIRDLEVKLTAVERKLNAEFGDLQTEEMEKRSLAEEVAKLEQKRHALLNQEQELQLRQARVQPENDEGRLVGDAQRLGNEIRAFQADYEKEGTKIRQFQVKHRGRMAISRDTLDRIKRKIGALKKTFENARS